MKILRISVQNVVLIASIFVMFSCGGKRRHLLRHFGSVYSSLRSKSSFGIAFDIDGVLYRGGYVFPSTQPSLMKLKKEKVPFLLLTNGGGVPYETKAKSLSKKLGVEIETNRLQYSHSPMKGLAEKYRDDLVLVFGREHAKDIVLSYGFRNVVSACEYHAQHPLMYPDVRPPPAERVEAWHAPVRAVLVVMDPSNWSRDLQLLVDVARSPVPATTCEDTHTHYQQQQQQPVDVYFSCPDLEYVGDYPHPRFASGSFAEVADFLFQRSTGRPLAYTMFGKPSPESYAMAEGVLQNQARDMGLGEVERFYMIGDNPESDIKGANQAGRHWTSVMVRSGVFRGGDNCEKHPADVVVEDVGEAVEWILQKEQDEQKKEQA